MSAAAPAGTPPAMPQTTASARLAGGPLRCEVDVGGRTVVADEPEALGGTDSAPTPQQLVAAALASCVTITIQMYAQRKEWDLSAVRVDVGYDPTAREPAYEVTVHLPDHLDGEQRERVMRVAAKCPVHRALEHGAEIVDRCVVSA